MKEKYTDCINYILNDGIIENHNIKNIDIIRNVLNDSEVGNRIYENFMHNFSLDFDEEDLAMKVQDLIYRINILINDCIISKNNISDYDDIRKIIDETLNQDIDLYSAVSYDDTDNDLQDEFNSILVEKDFNI